MATIGWIKVGAAVDTSQFAKGMSSMTAMTQKFEQTMGHLKGLLAGIGVTLGVKAFSDWIHSSIAAVAEQGKLAKRLGMTTEGFQKLSYAAKLSGVDQDQLTTSLEKMEERLAEVAIEGAGPASEALKRFGVNARVLTEMGGVEAFMTLVSVIEKIPNAMERVKVAKDIFGKSGQGMVNLALQGTAGLKAMGIEASALGVAMSGIDNAKLAEANVEFVKIGEAIMGVANSIAVQLSPYITEVSDKFIAWMKTGTTTGSYIAQAVDWITTAIGYVADAWQIAQTAFYGFKAILAEGLSYLTEGLAKFADAIIYLLELLPGVKIEGVNAFREMSKELEKLAVQNLDYAAEIKFAPWAHNAVRKLKDEIEAGAQTRATAAAGKQAAFAAPGSPVSSKIAETKFAGAAEQGTAAAYSARIGAQARLFDSKQTAIVDNTAKTAAHTERIAIAVESGKMRAGGPVDGIQYREQASGR